MKLPVDDPMLVRLRRVILLMAILLILASVLSAVVIWHAVVG